jgi:phospholipid/cholesterol/gamma-HCH transport system permease protein
LSAKPHLVSSGNGERFELTAAGSWTAAHAEELERATEALSTPGPAQRSVAVDVSALTGLDTYGAWLLERLLRRYGTEGARSELVGLAARYQGLFDEVRTVNREQAPVPPAEPKIFALLESLGRASAETGGDLLVLLEMFGAMFSAFLRILVHPARFRLTSAVHQLDRVGLQAVPIIILITLLIGGIIAQQGIFYFRKFGAGDYVVDLVGVLTLREIGVLIVAIMVAGRSGSSYTAELGTMKMREEIDALRTMGLDPVEVLILPRVLALIIALPALTFLGSMAALVGGGLVCWLYGGMSPEIFIARLNEAVSVTQFKVGIIKAPFMALVIGAVAACEGMRVKGSAESLGLGTTASVVKSIFLVIVLDGFFAMFFASIGM